MKYWHVIHTKPQRELLVHDQLENLDLESYLPLLKFERGYSRGIRIEALFPQYVFVRADLASQEATGLRWLPGVRNIVSYGNQPAIVPDDVLASLHAHLDSATDKVLRRSEWLFKPDQAVRVKQGPLQGFDAVFQKGLNGSDRVQILLNLLGTWVRTEIDLYALEAAPV